MRTTVRRIIVPLALCAALALAVVAQADDEEQLAPVWATINVCDAGGNQVGARVGVPGDGSDAQIYARFTVQWYSEKQGTWLPVQGVPSSPWLRCEPHLHSVGSARERLRAWAESAWASEEAERPKGGRLVDGVVVPDVARPNPFALVEATV